MVPKNPPYQNFSYPHITLQNRLANLCLRGGWDASAFGERPGINCVYLCNYLTFFEPYFFPRENGDDNAYLSGLLWELMGEMKTTF